MSTVGPDRGELEPAGYAELLQVLKQRVRAAQVRAARAANTEVLRLYWSIGRDILDRQEQAGWEAKVIDRLARDLRAEFPDQRGFSVRNLHDMRAAAEAWPTETDFLQQPAAQLPWTHLTTLLDRLDDPAHCHGYAAHALERGRSRNVLTHQINRSPATCTSSTTSGSPHTRNATDQAIPSR